MLCIQKMGPYGQKLLGKIGGKGKGSRNATGVGKRQ